MSVFTRDIGIDLGTASVLVYIKGKGIVLREPSVVAVDETTHTIIDVGTGALNMLGRTPRGISAIRPLKNGVISDYDLTERMIHYYLKQVLGRFSFARPRVVVCVPSGFAYWSSMPAMPQIAPESSIVRRTTFGTLMPM